MSGATPDHPCEFPAAFARWVREHSVQPLGDDEIARRWARLDKPKDREFWWYADEREAGSDPETAARAAAAREPEAHR